MMGVHVVAAGPLFTTRAEAESHRLVAACVTEVAREAQNRLVGSMAGTFRRPTPYYWTQVWTDRVTLERAEVNDARSGQPMIYGPWLEGVSSRNRASRFKGYGIWRRVRQRIRGDAPVICARVAPQYLRRMGA